jgi:hypothetical protein
MPRLRSLEHDTGQLPGRDRRQPAQMDYLHSSFGLNAWRAAGFGQGVRFAEAFHAAPLEQYKQLYGTFGDSNT